MINWTSTFNKPQGQVIHWTATLNIKRKVEARVSCSLSLNQRESEEVKAQVILRATPWKKMKLAMDGGNKRESTAPSNSTILRTLGYVSLNIPC